jgi:hypothetical protein
MVGVFQSFLKLQPRLSVAPECKCLYEDIHIMSLMNFAAVVKLMFIGHENPFFEIQSLSENELYIVFCPNRIVSTGMTSIPRHMEEHSESRT